MAQIRAPGPRGWAMFRAIRHFQHDPLDYFQWLGRFGSIVRTNAGPIVFHSFFSAEGLRQAFVDHANVMTKQGVIDDLLPILGDGLLASEGELWRNRRTALAPAFTRQATHDLAESIQDEVARHLDGWRGQSEIEVTGAMHHLAIKVIGRTLFHVDLSGRAALISEAVEQVSRQAFRRSGSIFKLPMAVPTPGNLAYRRAIAKLRAIVDDITREAGQQSPFMARLVETTQGNASAIADEVMTFLLAGHETTATTLTWAIGHLALDADWQERVQANINGDDATADPAHSESITDAVFSEALRLYPPGWMLMRRSQVELEIGGFKIPRRSFMVAPVFALHRMEQHWPEPTRFDPGRFLNGHGPADPLAFIPFGLGPRRCIGETFARLEGRIVLTEIMRRYRLQRQEPLPPPQPLTTLRPQGPVVVAIARRAGD